jgi:hypothetical protein
VGQAKEQSISQNKTSIEEKRHDSSSKQKRKYKSITR